MGTLLGVGVSHVFQQRALVRGERFTRAEQLRQERLQVYSSFAGALMMYRRAQMERWLICNGGEFEESHAALRARAFDLRVEVYEGLFRVRLVTGGAQAGPEGAAEAEAALERAQEALDCITRIPKAEGREEFLAFCTEAKEAVNDFVALAKNHL
ncbi:hypothetical protein [Streptomyces indicus]|uniref:hypothetical protein n=1 Tax=Streptomyces indicus TaxID=417292 RepID=UPI0015A19CC8|nr:hypothetical protein [Streptomyces indicus]